MENVFLFRFLIWKSAIKYKKLKCKASHIARTMWFLCFSSGLFHFSFSLSFTRPPTQTEPNNNQTLIQKLYSFLLFLMLNIKHFTFSQMGGKRERVREKKWKGTRESSEEIYICIIFCCFKRQIKFYLLGAPPSFVFELKYEIFIRLDWWQRKSTKKWKKGRQRQV